MDILCNVMKIHRHCFAVEHVHVDLIIEYRPDVDLKASCEQMGRFQELMPNILLRADGCETQFYKKIDMKISAPCSLPDGHYLFTLCHRHHVFLW